MTVHSLKRNTDISRSKYFLLYTPEKASEPIKIHYLITDTRSHTRPFLVFFAGFGEQDETALHDASRPFVEKGFDTIAVALPFHKMSPGTASWLISQGLQSLLKQLVADRPFILAGTSRGAAIAASATRLADDCQGLIMILPLGLNKLTTSTYVRRSFWNYLASLSFLDKAARKTSQAVLYEAWHHMKNPGGLTGAFRLALAQTENVTNCLKAFDTTAKKLAVFVGKQDRVFTLKECTESLRQILGKDSERVIIPLEGAHSTVGSRLGQSQLQAVAQWLATQYPASK